MSDRTFVQRIEVFAEVDALTLEIAEELGIDPTTALNVGYDALLNIHICDPRNEVSKDILEKYCELLEIEWKKLMETSEDQMGGENSDL